MVGDLSLKNNFLPGFTHMFKPSYYPNIVVHVILTPIYGIIGRANN